MPDRNAIPSRAAKHYSTEQALLDRGWKTKDGLWWPPDGRRPMNWLSFGNAIAWEAHRKANTSDTGGAA